MISMSISQAAELLGCAGPSAGGTFRGVSIDSRKITPGVLFAALGGMHADGHDFAPAALASGAAAVLVSRRLELPPEMADRQLVVEDVLLALGSLARAWRQSMDPVVTAITGSNGKTTTRAMVTSILERGARVLSTTGNYNNELGLPLTLFELGPEHGHCVLEMGASKRGDIRYLAGVAQPRIGLVTNIGPAHLKGFGNEAGVASAKGELYENLPADGIAVINADEPWKKQWLASSTAGRYLTFGSDSDCDVFARPDARGHRVHTPLGEFQLELPLPGDHNLQNAMAATAVAVALEIPPEQVREGLEAVQPVPGRLNILHTQAGWTVIDDTYNANPASLYAALQVLTGAGGEAWLVLGDMKELGQGSRKMHGRMGEAARALGVTRIYALGDSTEFTVDAFGPGGRHFSNHEALLETLSSDIRPGVTCLVKGSRSMAMEQVVRAITRSGDLREAG